MHKYKTFEVEYVGQSKTRLIAKILAPAKFATLPKNPYGWHWQKYIVDTFENPFEARNVMRCLEPSSDANVNNPFEYHAYIGRQLAAGVADLKVMETFLVHQQHNIHQTAHMLGQEVGGKMYWRLASQIEIDVNWQKKFGYEWLIKENVKNAT